jgi:hypothetical protein
MVAAYALWSISPPDAKLQAADPFQSAFLKSAQTSSTALKLVAVQLWLRVYKSMT